MLLLCMPERVTTMDTMFQGATSFRQKLGGAAWVNLKASQPKMFEGSPGLIPPTACAVFVRQSKVELQSAVDGCLTLSSQGNCPDGPHGPIGEWDVSTVADMSGVFSNTKSFDGDISKWGMATVETMSNMFRGVTSFNSDISNWDVSSVICMRSVFSNAKAFDGDISKWDASSVKYVSGMFGGATSFNGDISECDVSSVQQMSTMFRWAGSFNGDISKWNVCGSLALVVCPC